MIYAIADKFENILTSLMDKQNKDIRENTKTVNINTNTATNTNINTKTAPNTNTATNTNNTIN